MIMKQTKCFVIYEFKLKKSNKKKSDTNKDVAFNYTEMCRFAVFIHLA